MRSVPIASHDRLACSTSTRRCPISSPALVPVLAVRLRPGLPVANLRDPQPRLRARFTGGAASVRRA
jgi:hypothetical protein